MTDRLSRPDSWRADFIARSGFRCHYCNRSGGDIGPGGKPWHVDHKTPLARGGADSEENLVLACKRCNLVKHTQSYKQFAAFAALAFWVEDDGQISDDELNYLMQSWARAGDDAGGGADPKWRYQNNGADEPSRVYLIGADGDPRTILAPPEGIPAYYLKETDAALRLAAQMYEALPALIAEIRMHREAERQSQLAAEPPVE